MLCLISRCVIVMTSCFFPDGQKRASSTLYRNMKKKKIEFRLTSLEKAIIEKKAENSGITTSEFCRRSALNQQINSRLTHEELEVYKMLTVYSNNFQRIGNLLKEKDSNFYIEVKRTATEIREIIKKLSNGR